MRKRRGFNVAAYDITYGESSKGGAHDFLESAGFLSQPQGNTQMHACMFFGIPHMHALRVACFGILKLHAGCMSLMAPDCRSWGAPARGTSFRNPLNPNGVGRQFVMDGNKMASRFLACMEFKLENNIYAYIMYTDVFIHEAGVTLPSMPKQPCHFSGGATSAKPPICILQMAVASESSGVGILHWI